MLVFIMSLTYNFVIKFCVTMYFNINANELFSIKHLDNINEVTSYVCILIIIVTTRLRGTHYNIRYS